MIPEKYNLVVVKFDPIWLLNATHSFSSQSHSVSSSPPMLKWHSFCSKCRGTAARQETGRCAARFKRKKKEYCFRAAKCCRVGNSLWHGIAPHPSPDTSCRSFPSELGQQHPAVGVRGAGTDRLPSGSRRDNGGEEDHGQGQQDTRGEAFARAPSLQESAPKARLRSRVFLRERVCMEEGGDGRGRLQFVLACDPGSSCFSGPPTPMGKKIHVDMGLQGSRQESVASSRLSLTHALPKARIPFISPFSRSLPAPCAPGMCAKLMFSEMLSSSLKWNPSSRLLPSSGWLLMRMAGMQLRTWVILVLHVAFSAVSCFIPAPPFPSRGSHIPNPPSQSAQTSKTRVSSAQTCLF